MFGAFSGALSMAFFLSFSTTGGDVWLILVCSVGLVVGVVTTTSMALTRLALAIALGFALSMVVMQYGLSTVANLEPWVAYSITGGCVLLAGLMSYAVLPFALLVASSVFGGFVVMLAVANLLHAQYSLVGWWFDPKYLIPCVTVECCTRFALVSFPQRTH